MSIGAFSGLSIILEYRLGILERIWSAPSSGRAVIGGRIGCDVLLMSAPILVVLLLSVLLGARPSLLGLATIAVTVIGTGVTFSGMSYAIALRTKSEASLSAIFNVALLPLLLLSGIMLPLSFAPHWIASVARFNPLWYLVTGARDQFERVDLAGSAVIAWAISVGGAAAGYLWGSHEFGKRR